MDEYFTWELISTLAGASAAVTLITQVMKQFVRAEPKLIAFVAAVVVQVGVLLLYRQDVSPEGILLAALNVFVTLSASVGMFELVAKPLVNTKKP